MFNNHITWNGSASANDRSIPAYGSFNIWWRNITKKKLSANLYSNREIRFARVFPVELLNDYVRGNQFSEVVHDKSGKYLLGNVLHLFCVEMEQAHCVFQFPERGFDSPAHTIKTHQFIRWKFFYIQVCNNRFVCRVRYFESDNTERQGIE